MNSYIISLEDLEACIKYSKVKENLDHEEIFFEKLTEY